MGAVIDKYYSGTARDVLLDGVAQLVENDLVLQPNPDVPTAVSVISDPVLISESPLSMSVRLC